MSSHVVQFHVSYSCTFTLACYHSIFTIMQQLAVAQQRHYFSHTHWLTWSVWLRRRGHLVSPSPLPNYHSHPCHYPSHFHCCAYVDNWVAGDQEYCQMGFQVLHHPCSLLHVLMGHLNARSLPHAWTFPACPHKHPGSHGSTCNTFNVKWKWWPAAVCNIA